jgi:hypothetical protein
MPTRGWKPKRCCKRASSRVEMNSRLTMTRRTLSGFLLYYVCSWLMNLILFYFRSCFVKLGMPQLETDL